MAADGPPTHAELADQLRRLSIDLPAVLAAVPVPVYVVSRTGVIRWLNEAGLDVFGDRRGEHYSAIVAPEARQRVDEQFARKILGTALQTSYEAILLTREGEKIHVDLDSVRVGEDTEVVGVFGLAEPERLVTPAGAAKVQLTPRQREVLGLLARGCSTKQMAAELHLSTETVRNHIRGLLRGLSVHSRLEAVSRAKELDLV